MDNKPALVYFHLTKTAGTSLRTSLVNALGPDSCSPPFVQTHMSEDEAAHYRRFPIICGHISRADQQRWFDDRAVFTLLREPIDRCLSFIHYVLSLPANVAKVADDARQMPLMDFIETEQAQHNLFNTMTRQLGAHILDLDADLPAAFAAAQETLKQSLWVGRQDRLDVDLPRLGAALGVDIQPVRENVTPSRPPREQESEALIARLRELNAYDFALWESVAA